MGKRIVMSLVVAVALSACNNGVRQEPLNQPPEGFVSLFNGKDLSNWKIFFPNIDYLNFHIFVNSMPVC